MNLNYFFAPIAAALLFLHAGVCAQAATPKYKIVAYYLADTAAHNFTPDDIKANKLTHVNYAFADIKNGEVMLGDSHSKDNFLKLRRLKEKIRI